MNLSVCLLVGDNNTAHCGVKDYAHRLAASLRETGVDVEVMAPPSWNTRSFLPFARSLRSRNFDIVHLQYPSVGHRASLWPHWLGCMVIARKYVVTLHEYSSLPASQRLATHIFGVTANRLIFTTNEEMKNYGPTWVRKCVVSIGSSVPAYPHAVAKTPKVLYFGQIRPGKGLEDYLALAERSHGLKLPFTFQVLGSVLERRKDYFKALRECTQAPVEWTLDASFEDVARTMAGSLAAYLPFPDGASCRKSSLLAALTNGLPVITRISQSTPSDMASVLLSAGDLDSVLGHLQRLQDSPQEAAAMSAVSRHFAGRFSWSHIAQGHTQLYLELLHPPGRSSAAGTPQTIRAGGKS